VTVYVLPPGPRTPDLRKLDVTTHGSEYRPLSPMLLGPVPLYAGLWSRTMENAWQFSKLYPGCDYWPWALAGWDNPRGVRHPFGRSTRPLCSLWAGDQLDYVTARRRIYIPLYTQAVRMYQLPLLDRLKQLASQGTDFALTDFDAYDHRALGYSWDDVTGDPDRKMGHGFVLAMMIEGAL
jgi:hypothetical protein